MTATAIRLTPRQRAAARAFDRHGDSLTRLASLWVSTPDRADRLVIAAIAGHVGRPRWRRRPPTLSQLAGSVHDRWVATRAPRHGDDEAASDASVRDRLRGLDHQQLGVLGLCLFGGHSTVAAGTSLDLTPTQASHLLRDALHSLAS